LIKDGIDGILPFPVPGNTIDFLPTSISGDPRFVRGFDIHDPLYYSLSEGSPCIDAGTRDTTGLNLPPYDLAGNHRIWNDRIDMGCFEFDSRPWVSIDDPVLPPVPETSITTYPNPFNAFTNIKIGLSAFAENKQETIHTACINIYNLKGQKVQSIALDPKRKDEQLTPWNGEDANGKSCASGIYFLNLSINGRHSLSKKVTLIR
jgi:hypothetical protein